MPNNYSPELVDQLVTYIRDAAAFARKAGFMDAWSERVIELAALLPPPTDPDLLEARKVLAAWLEAKGDSPAADCVLEGDWDDMSVCEVLLFHIKHQHKQGEGN